MTRLLASLRRFVGASLLVGLAMVVLPSPATAAPEPAQDTAQLCAGVPDDFHPFTDLSDNSHSIECVGYSRIATGTGYGTTFSPGPVVSREQMASFVARFIDSANALETVELFDLPPDDGNDYFDDPVSEAHAPNVTRLFLAGIVSGGPGGRPEWEYGADLAVTRGQMATFLNHAVDFMFDGEVDGVGAYASDEEIFTDNTTLAHAENVRGLASTGIVVGFDDGRYGPGLGVTRSQMASFLVRTLAQMHDDGEVDALPAPAKVVLDSPMPILAGTEDLRLTIVGPYIQSVGVRAAFYSCINNNDVGRGHSEDADPVADGFQVVIPLAEDAPAGACELEVFVGRGAALGYASQDTPLTVDVLPQAPDAGEVTAQVMAVDPFRDYFVSEVQTYFRYDDNDRFLVDGSSVTMEEFEAALQPGDALSIRHYREPTQESVFRMT